MPVHKLFANCCARFVWLGRNNYV